MDLGPTGKLLEPLGDLPFEKAVNLYKEVIGYALEIGVDLILIETMTDAYEAKAAVLALYLGVDAKYSFPLTTTLMFIR